MLKLPLSLRVERIGLTVILFTALAQKFKRSTWKNRHLRRAVQNRFKLRDECTLHISCLGIRTEAVCLYTCGSAALGGRASHCPHSRLIATCTLAAAATTTTLPPPPPSFARRAPHTRSVPHTSSIAIIYLYTVSSTNTGASQLLGSLLFATNSNATHLSNARSVYLASAWRARWRGYTFERSHPRRSRIVMDKFARGLCT